MTTRISAVKALLEAHGRPEREVYYDLENSPRVPAEVVKAMLPYFNVKGYGHPSITHRPGWEAVEIVESTREAVAGTINAEPENITFTPSGTAANNLALVGSCMETGKGKIVISAVEHESVIFPAIRTLGSLGYRVVQAPVDEDGLVDPEILASLVDKSTVLVSVQLVNHEIGTIQKVREIAEYAKDANSRVLVHTDAADGWGWIPIDVERLGVDLLTLSGRKIQAPRGVGILWVRDGVKMRRIVEGPLSTQSLWPGVENTPIIAGLREAIKLAFEDMEGRAGRVAGLRDRLMEGILGQLDDVILNGPRGAMRSPDNLNISFLHVEGEALTIELSTKGIYVSSGSACTSRVLEPSHVMLAIGRKYEEAHGSILFKLTKYHTMEDVKYTIENVLSAVERLRKISAIRGGLVE